VNAVVDSLSSSLIWLLVAAVVVAVVAFIASRPAWLATLGRWVDELFGSSSDLPAPVNRRSRWVERHLVTLRVAGVAVAVVVLLVAPKTWSWLLLVVLALVAYELLLTAFGIGERAAEAGEEAEPPGG
jgi:hypothetical protein